MAGCQQFFVLTGGPGSGKTSLLSLLSNRGYSVMPEAGRSIIRDQVSIGGSALPWADRYAFAELMLSWEMRSHHEAGQLEGPVFFDRGLPDVVGYLQVCGLNVAPHILAAASKYRYNSLVFIAPPWRDIFQADQERKQSWEEAATTFKAMEHTYKSLGYDVIMLPLATVEERAAFIYEQPGIRTLNQAGIRL